MTNTLIILAMSNMIMYSIYDSQGQFQKGKRYGIMAVIALLFFILLELSRL